MLKVIPKNTREQDEANELAMNHVLSKGITFVQDMGTFVWFDCDKNKKRLDEFQVYQRAWENKKLRVRRQK